MVCMLNKNIYIFPFNLFSRYVVKVMEIGD